MRRTVLITGATGQVSSALTAALEDADVDVRILVRDRAKAGAPSERGVEVVGGDLGDPGTLAPAFDGVSDLWLLTANGPRAPEHSMNALWAARREGVERVVRLSAVNAAHDAPTRSGRLHALSDHELGESGMAWTIVRPHYFMQNLLSGADRVAADRILALNLGQGRLGMIDVRDIAEFAARILLSEPGDHHGRIYTPTGPEAISLEEAASQLGDVLGREVRYVPVSDDVAYQGMVAGGAPEWIAGMVVEYAQAHAAGWGDFTTSDFEDVVGHPPRNIADFARDHAEAFGAVGTTR